jgi:tetratricopeptide (TPR) repeat protein
VFVGTIVAVAALFGSSYIAANQTKRAMEAAQLAKTEADRVRKLQLESEKLRSQVSGLREALSASRFAIAAFHQRDYATAVRFYDEALRADPNDAYLLNLRAYALFKQHKYDEALATELRSVDADPNYAWGYFDLARFQCAIGKRDDARKSIAKALKINPELRDTIRGDGEFRQLCGDVVP